MDELDALVNDEPEVTETVEVEAVKEETQVTETIETVADEPEVEVEKEVTPTVTDKPESETVPIAAVIDERRKRQALEQEIAGMKAQQVKEQPARPDVFEDQNGAFHHLESEADMKLNQRVIGLSRDMMESTHDDYAEIEQEFVKMAQANPQLTQEMLSHPNPARFAYETAKKQKEYTEMQDVDTYKAKLTAEIRAELKAEQVAETEKETAKTTEKTNIVNMPNLAKSTASSGGFATPTDESLDEIIGR